MRWPFPFLGCVSFWWAFVCPLALSVSVFVHPWGGIVFLVVVVVVVDDVVVDESVHLDFQMLAVSLLMLVMS